jgi:RNA polymerase sigma-70 factor (ECF subfamily)
VSTPPATDPDSADMLALAGGRDTALHGLMDRWRDKVAAFLHRMTGCQETALDLAQETFVRVWQARHRYEAGGRFSTWLFAIAANLARNHARWRSRHPEAPLPEDDLRPDSSLDPAATAAAREQIRAVQRAIAALPPDLREALVLSVYHEMPHAEIAAALGCSAKAVETRIYRARQHLREVLVTRLG